MKPRETSLIYILNKEIRESGYISFQRMEQICRDNLRKPSNGERRLRHSESPTVEAVMNDKGAIVGYKYRPEMITKNPKLSVVNQMIENNAKSLFPSYPSLNESTKRWMN